MPQNAFLHASYFTLRSGGRTIITFLFDSVFIWVVSVSVAFTLSRFTALPVLAIYALVQAADFIKCIIGFILVKKVYGCVILSLRSLWQIHLLMQTFRSV